MKESDTSSVFLIDRRRFRVIGWWNGAVSPVPASVVRAARGCDRGRLVSGVGVRLPRVAACCTAGAEADPGSHRAAGVLPRLPDALLQRTGPIAVKTPTEHRSEWLSVPGLRMRPGNSAAERCGTAARPSRVQRSAVRFRFAGPTRSAGGFQCGLPSPRRGSVRSATHRPGQDTFPIDLLAGRRFR
jgi:hypothetical protein